MNAEISVPRIDLALEGDFRLGELHVRPSRRELAHRDQRETLEPRVMQVLVALARRRGEVVSREELVATCWAGRIVGEDAVSASVAKARRAGETCGAYQIETIPRVGYRLMTSHAPSVRASANDVLLTVLAFDNLSSDADMGFFSDGISEEILHTLAQRTDLKVIGRSSSFELRGADKTIPNIVRQLGATHVLDGSVRRSGEQARISAQLIDCATQTTLWADRFEGRLPDLFALQDQVAAAVAHAMQSALAPAVRSGAVDPIAYDLYLRGVQPPELLSGAYGAEIGMLRECVQRAPDFAEAWGSLGYLLANRAHFRPQAEGAGLREEARRAAAHALDLDPRCARAAIAMARSMTGFEDLVGHAEWLDRALAWSPDDMLVMRLYGRMQASMGQVNAALQLMRRAQRLHPLDLHILAMFGRVLVEAGELEEARAVLEGVRRRWSEFQLLPLWGGITLALLGRLDEARRVLSDYDLGPYTASLAGFIHMQSLDGPEAGAFSMGLLRDQIARESRVTLDLLSLAAHFGDAGEALDLAASPHLASPVETSDRAAGAASDLAMLFSRPLSEIRRDPRFVGLCDRLGLIDYWRATDRWPDCVDEVAGIYDFRAECERIVGAR